MLPLGETAKRFLQLHVNLFTMVTAETHSTKYYLRTAFFDSPWNSLSRPGACSPLLGSDPNLERP